MSESRYILKDGYEECLEYQNQEIDELRKTQDYTKLAVKFGNSNMLYPGQLSGLDALFLLYNEIPDNQKYDIVFSVYTNMKAPTVYLKELILDVKKYRPNDIIEPLKQLADSNGNIVVYRGTGKNERNPQCSFSWTLKIEVAEHFASRYFITRSHTKHYYIYKGEININDIIHYTNCREEFEVIQYESVKNIEVDLVKFTE